MQKTKEHKIPASIFKLMVLLLLAACTSSDPFINNYLLEDEWLIDEVHAPNYPFPESENRNAIQIAFPKSQEYELTLKDYTCNGTYEAKNNGELHFKRTNCSSTCCNSQWDHYIITLLKKVRQFESEQEKSLKLIINDTNYLSLIHAPTTKPITE